jgi:malate dehydrogenase (oxaloacetate-decarboxylating)
MTMHVADPAFDIHRGGKIEIRNKVPLRTKEDLALAYTPGFARVARAIHEHPDEVYRLSNKHNSVAVVTDGSAVSGIGDVGPEAALPVMEGKAMLFKRFADIDAFPICLGTKDVDEIVRVVKCLEPTFAAIMLEDIAAPRCFEIERRLDEELTIPVLHDDQHATAGAATAALINALKLVGKQARDVKVVMVGAGAAGTACAKMFMRLGITNIVACDRHGAIYRGRQDLTAAKRWFADHANPGQERGSLSDVMGGADVFLGLSGPGAISVADVRSMAADPIVFALANPTPEILPAEVEGVAAVIATGRSDFPNQIDCGLCYPGLFRGALDCYARRIDDAMKMAAARAVAEAVDESSLDRQHIVPSIFDDGIADKVAAAVRRAAVETGSARATPGASRRLVDALE